MHSRKPGDASLLSCDERARLLASAPKDCIQLETPLLAACSIDSTAATTNTPLSSLAFPELRVTFERGVSIVICVCRR